VKSPTARRPVFHDSTGRRHRVIRRAGAVLAVPAVGYLILMASSLLGGPRLDTPLIPLPEAARPAPRPLVTPGPAAVEPLRPSETARTPTSEPTSTPTTGSTPSATPTLVPTPTVVPTTPVTGSPTTPPGKPTTTPTTAHTTSRPTAPPGRTKSPSKP
jgi:hypothetical protein